MWLRSNNTLSLPRKDSHGGDWEMVPPLQTRAYPIIESDIPQSMELTRISIQPLWRFYVEGPPENSLSLATRNVGGGGRYALMPSAGPRGGGRVIRMDHGWKRHVWGT